MIGLGFVQNAQNGANSAERHYAQICRPGTGNRKILGDKLRSFGSVMIDKIVLSGFIHHKT